MIEPIIMRRYSFFILENSSLVYFNKLLNIKEKIIVLKLGYRTCYNLILEIGASARYFLMELDKISQNEKREGSQSTNYYI